MGLGGLLLAMAVGGAGGVLGATIGLIASANQSAEAKARRTRIFAAIGVAPGIVAGQLAATTPLGDWADVKIGRKSRAEVAVVRALQPLLTSDKFKNAVKGKSEAEASALGRSLAARGVPLLTSTDLDAWARSRLHLGELSPLLCAQLWKGGAEQKELYVALDKFSDDELRDWANLSVHATELALDQKPPPQISPDTGPRAIQAITESLPANEQAAFSEDVVKTTLTDARACSIHQTVMTGSAKLPEDLRLDFYRLLASQM